ncbi:MAG: PEP-CTERM sorting domain-containing protein [Planctomycetota bacterium]
MSLHRTVVVLFVLSSVANAATITEVDLANNRIELVNLTGETIDMSGWFWCNRVNGTPSFYTSFANDGEIDTSLSTAGTSFGSFSAGDVMVIELGAGILNEPNGELGIYDSSSFSSPDAVVDYIAWGANGVRDVEAQSAGLWIDNTFIPTPTAGESIQLTFGTAGNIADDYFTGAPNLGTFVPEPSTLGLLIVGLVFMIRRIR